MEVLNALVPEKLLTLILALVMSVNMSGCRGTVDATDTKLASSTVTSEQTVTTAQKIKDYNDTDSKDGLPGKMSVDDLQSGIRINNNSIKFGLPTTIHEIISVDNRLSYKAHDNYGNVEDYFNNCNGKARYDIYYDDLYILHVIINQDNYSGDLENTEVSSISGGFYNKDIDPAETDISFFSTLSLESDYNDIISYLGTPDTIFDYNMKYNFSYNGTSYFIEFNYDSLDFSTSPAKLLGIYIVTKRS
ncbi:MAG: hypothetical protein J6I96_05130 [Oscillospiraceae bacterium]|nr:hypothetical protein [Oscillospiraceae bacterium]